MKYLFFALILTTQFVFAQDSASEGVKENAQERREMRQENRAERKGNRQERRAGMKEKRKARRGSR